MGYSVTSHSQGPSFKRMKAFIDGENLTIRYQESAKERTPRDNIFLLKDVYVWIPEVIQWPGQTEVFRATYYTSAVGDDQTIGKINTAIKQLTFINHGSTLPNNLKPVVYKKKEKGKKVKGIDIKLVVDILSEVFNNNLDIVYLVSGDGDFLPVIKEAQRRGKLVYLAAFSSGLNPALLNYVDRYYCLDSVFFKDEHEK